MRSVELRAWGLGGLTVTENPEPVAGPGQIAVRIRAAALNYRDILTAEGKTSDATLPYVPLSDGTGEIISLGQGVTEFSLGDRVSPIFFPDWMDGQPTAAELSAVLGGSRSGVLQEVMIVDARSAVRLPSHLSFEEGATLACAGLTAWSAVHDFGALGPGDSVLIQGTGGVSLFAITLAKALGATVLVTSSSDDKLARARALGADLGINYTRTPDWAEQVRALTNGLGVDLVLDVGGAETLDQSLSAARIGGKVAAIGVLTGHRATLSIGTLMRRKIRLSGILVGSRAGMAAMCEFVEAEHLRPVVGATFTMDDVASAFRAVQGGVVFGKVVVSL